jgi:hypothetical protein
MFDGIAVLQQTGSPASSPSVVWLILTALVGVVAGALGAYVNARVIGYTTMKDFDNALDRERQRTFATGKITAEIARDAALDTELREAVRQFATAAGSMIHSMCWLTWDCTARNRIDEGMVTNYDAEAHKLSPTIVAQLAVIGMLSRDVHRKLSSIVDEIFALDLELSNAIVAEQQVPVSPQESLKGAYEQSYALETKLRNGVENLFGSRAERPDAEP